MYMSQDSNLVHSTQGSWWKNLEENWAESRGLQAQNNLVCYLNSFTAFTNVNDTPAIV